MRILVPHASVAFKSLTLPLSLQGRGDPRTQPIPPIQNCSLRQNRSAFPVEALPNGIGQAKSCLVSDEGVAPPGLPPFAQLIEIEINA